MQPVTRNLQLLSKAEAAGSKLSALESVHPEMA